MAAAEDSVAETVATVIAAEVAEIGQILSTESKYLITSFWKNFELTVIIVW